MIVNGNLTEVNQVVFVVGDVMLDKYIFGVVNRISPEAPVPVLDVSKKSERPGGAANVALNLYGLQLHTILFSVIGKDDASVSLLNYFEKEGLSSEGILKSSSRRTSKKIRVMSNGQHLLRIDEEDAHSLSSEEEKDFLAHILSLWSKYKPIGIVLQDYNKGVLTPFIIKSLISMAKEMDIPVVVDPKDLHFWDYQGVTIFKPNKKEIQKKIPFLFENNRSDLKRVSDYIFSKLDCEISVITLGEDGLWIANRSSCFWIKGIKQEISDVSGAGDAVISSLVWSLIKQVDLETMGNIANAAGAQVCARSGVVSLELHSFTNYYLNLYSVQNK
jgi:rfaE bifunctional protein kinase chain/domain